MLQATIGRHAPPALAHAEGIARVAQFLREQPDEALTVRDLAGFAYLSPFHFIRVFRQITGSAPADFRAALRLEAAKRLLLTTPLDVMEVCQAVGYQSLGTFTTRFTQLVGLPPGRLRERALALDIPRAAPFETEHAGTATETGAVIRGSITGVDVVPGPLFVGLFPDPIAQGHPIAGALLPAPGPYVLTGVPDGCYYLWAAALPWSGSPLAYLLPDDDARLRIGRSAGPLSVRRGQVSGERDLALRPRQPTDPPLVVALPALLCARWHQAA